MKKHFLLKHRGILIALLCFLCVTSIKAQTTWTAPNPEGTAFEAGIGYYVYNVGGKSFLGRGGDYSTQAILASGALITPVQSSTSWILQYDDATKTLFVAWPGIVFTDGASADNIWNIQPTDDVNHVYSIQVTGYFNNPSQYLGASSTAYTSNDGIVYDVRHDRAASDYTKWKFCTAAAVAKYNAQVQLDKYMKIAQLIGSSVDLTSYITTYNTGTTAEISTAATNLSVALAPTDKTSSINNPNFDSNPSTGWTESGSGSLGYGSTEVQFYQQTHDLNQTLTGLLPGVYVVKVSGFDRPNWLDTYNRSLYTNGWAALNSRFYATASGVKTFQPLRSIYSETTCPSGDNVDGSLYPNWMDQAQTDITAGKYDNELGYVTVDASRSLTIGLSNSFENDRAGRWIIFDNFRLYYYGAIIGTSVTSLGYDNLYTSSSFTLTGPSLTSDITLTVPSGITLTGTNITGGSGTYTIVAANANTTNTITATWDGSTPVLQNNITISATSSICGSTSTQILVNCYTPLYSTGNLIADPYCNSYLNGWGTRSTNTNPTYVYCGSSSAYINDGSIDRVLNGTNGNAQMQPNTTYRVKAKVWKVSGLVGIGVWGWSSGQSDIYHEVTTAGSWQDVDFTFTSGATLGVDQGIFFNRGEGYIDNWEMYATPTFTGTGDWSNTGNWSIGSVPVSTDIVAIDGAATISANTVLNGIIINSGKSLTVSPDKQLTVNATLTNNGTLNLLSTSDGTATILAPALIGGTGGTVNVQQYLTGSGTPSTPNGRYWYLTTPVVGATSNAFTPATNYLWSYSEAQGTLASVYTKITETNVGLDPGTGYVARMAASGNISLAGTSLFNDDKTFTLSYASSDPTKKGFNLIGNPYPCYLNIKTAFTEPSGFETSAWYRSSSDGLSNVFDTFNASTGVGITIGSGVDQATLAIIPPMQAFWVRATNATNSLTFSKTTRSHKPATNGNNLRSAATSDVKQIRLNVSNGTNTDQTLIGFYAQAMDEFDNCDSRKMFNGVANLPEIYSLAGSTIVAINGLPLLTDTREIALGFKTAQAGSFTIKAAEILNLEADQTVILKDIQLNVSQNLTEQPVYSFSSDAVTTTTRFSIVIGKMATALKLAQKTSFDVRALNNGQMEIALDGATQASVKVFDTVGRQVFAQDILSQTSPLSKTFSKGVYLVKVSIGGVESTKKVVINL